MRWIIYDIETLIIESIHESEPVTPTDKLKVQTNHYFPPSQSLENYEYSNSSVNVRSDTSIDNSTFTEEDYVVEIESNKPLMNQGAIFEPYFIQGDSNGNSIPNVVDGVFNWKVPFDGDYRMELFYRFSINNTSVNFLGHVKINNAEFLFPNHVELKDSAGPSLSVPRVSNSQVISNDLTGTDQFILSSGNKSLKGLIKGTVIPIKLEFRGQSQNQEATIYESNILIYPYKNKNV